MWPLLAEGWAAILTTKRWGVNGPTRRADHRSQSLSAAAASVCLTEGPEGQSAGPSVAQEELWSPERDALSPEGGTQGRDLRPGQADLRDAG